MIAPYVSCHNRIRRIPQPPTAKLASALSLKVYRSLLFRNKDEGRSNTTARDLHAQIINHRSVLYLYVRGSVSQTSNPTGSNWKRKT